MSHSKLVPNPHIPPTRRVEDCICGGMTSSTGWRHMIVCPACDGVVSFHTEPCDCGDVFWDELIGDKND